MNKTKSETNSLKMALPVQRNMRTGKERFFLTSTLSGTIGGGVSMRKWL